MVAAIRPSVTITTSLYCSYLFTRTGWNSVLFKIAGRGVSLGALDRSVLLPFVAGKGLEIVGDEGRALATAPISLVVVSLSISSFSVIESDIVADSGALCCVDRGMSAVTIGFRGIVVSDIASLLVVVETCELVALLSSRSLSGGQVGCVCLAI